MRARRTPPGDVNGVHVARRAHAAQGAAGAAGFLGAQLEALDTPALVADLDRVEANLVAMAAAIGRHGVALRPHVKTHKTPALAHRQVAAGATGITVAKLDEAGLFADHGFDDILVAYQVVGPTKVARLIELSRRVTVRSCVSDLEAARALSAAATDAGVDVELSLDVDAGLERTGCRPDEAADLGAAIAALPGLRLSGVFAYAGYPLADPDEEVRRRWAEQEAGVAVSVASALRRTGVPISAVSVSGTSCAPYAAAVPGVTEVRPGTYVFGDANCARLGVQPFDRCALTVIATVVGRPTPTRAVLDAGTKVLAADQAIGPGATGYGVIPALPGATISRAWEEHAVVDLPLGNVSLAVGDRVAIVPNHVCVVVNLAERWFGARGGVVTEIHEVDGRAGVH